MSEYNTLLLGRLKVIIAFQYINAYLLRSLAVQLFIGIAVLYSNNNFFNEMGESR